MRRSIYFLLSLFAVITAHSDENIFPDSMMTVRNICAEDSLHSTISIQCSVEHVRIVLDTTVIGMAPIMNHPVTAGRHIIFAQQSDSWNYFSTSVAETIIVGQSEHIKRTILFPKTVTICSDPFGAEVRYNDSLLGRTPLHISQPESGSFQLSKNGYRLFSLSLPVHGTMFNAVLEPFESTEQKSSSFIRQLPKTPPSFYITASAAVLSGTAAVYFKILADRQYREYQRTGDGTILCHVERLDVAAGISLAVSEISLFALYSLLLSQ